MWCKNSIAGIGYAIFCVFSAAAFCKKSGNPKTKNFRVSSEISTGWIFCRNQALYMTDFLYRTNEKLFWTFLSDLKGHDFKAPNEDFNGLLEAIQVHTSKRSHLLKLLRLNVEMETAAPKIEAVAKSQSEMAFPNCSNFIEYDSGKFVCSFEDLQAKSSSATLKPNDLDYIYSTDSTAPFLRLYAIPGSSGFVKLYEELKEASDDGKYSFALQFIPRPKRCPFYESEVRPTGYGLEFEIKASQYVVEEPQEDLSGVEEDEASKLHLYKSFQVAEKEDVKAIPAFDKIKEEKHVFTRALGFIMKSNSLAQLQNCATNFVWLAPQLQDHKLPVKNLMELKDLQSKYDSSHNLYRINDFDLTTSNLDPFKVIDFFNEFFASASELHVLGFDERHMRQLIHSRLEPSEPAAERELYYKFPSSSAIVYLNDLEKDKQYSDWPKSFKDSEKLTAEPGVFLAKNIVTVIFPIDFSRPESENLLGNVAQLISSGYPLRFGVVPVVRNKNDNVALYVQTFYAIHEAAGLRAAFTFLKNVLMVGGGYSAEFTPEELIEFLLDQLNVQISDENAGAAQVNEALNLTETFSLHDAMGVFANGLYMPITSDLIGNILDFYKSELETSQTLFNEGKIDDSTNLYDHLLREKKTVGKRSTTHDVLHKHLRSTDELTTFKLQKLLSIGHYAVKGDSGSSSVWLAGDFSKQGTFNLVTSALELVTTDTQVRLITLSAMNSLPNRIVIAAAALLAEEPRSLEGVVKFLEVFSGLYFGGLDKETDFSKIPPSIESEKILKYAKTPDSNVIQAIRVEDSQFFEVFSISEWNANAEAFLAVNGNGYRVSEAGELSTIYAFEMKQRGYRHEKLIISLGLAKQMSEAMIVFSFVERKLLSRIAHQLPHFLTASTSHLGDISDSNTIRIGDPLTSVFHVEAIFNPFNRDGQKFSSIMNYLGQSDLFSFALTLNFDIEASDPKTVRIYRFVTPEYRDVPIPIVPVSDPDTLMAMTLDLPTTWMTLNIFSNTDLDNIRPLKVPHLKTTFLLKQIIIEGQVVFDDNQEVAVGKVVQMYSDQSGLLEDQTSVMANYGYYQLKSAPGRWNLRIISGLHEGEDPLEYPIVSGSSVLLTSFAGSFNRIRIARDPLKITLPRVTQKHADINVFSLASGMFYERLLRIMIRSVLKNSKGKSVKFWLLETTLSPKAALALETMSKHYEFEYELMAYKWPFWLNPQSKKHRTIWAYKVLFLDVLFPQDLKRVIFIDADQVVRSDLSELMELDLKEHVYAMTPFCSDKPEMSEYRFWERNYWKEQLQGKPYHISALFVVDLLQMRKQLVADIIRAQYQALSQDPNSLSNLDQDLPNNLQNHIPIYSLPQEWLWCDTWCSADTKSKAKTIDLCNNPKTFESKLDQALRIIPEWSKYNQEIEELLAHNSEHEEGDFDSKFNDHIEL